MSTPTDCVRCPQSIVVETDRSAVVLCGAEKPAVVVTAFPRRTRLALQTVAPRAGCPRRGE